MRRVEDLDGWPSRTSMAAARPFRPRDSWKRRLSMRLVVFPTAPPTPKSNTANSLPAWQFPIFAASRASDELFLTKAPRDPTSLAIKVLNHPSEPASSIPAWPPGSSGSPAGRQEPVSSPRFKSAHFRLSVVGAAHPHRADVSYRTSAQPTPRRPEAAEHSRRTREIAGTSLGAGSITTNIGFPGLGSGTARPAFARRRRCPG